MSRGSAGARIGIPTSAMAISDALGTVEDFAVASSPTSASTPAGEAPPRLPWRRASVARSSPGPCRTRSRRPPPVGSPGRDELGAEHGIGGELSLTAGRKTTPAASRTPASQQLPCHSLRAASPHNRRWGRRCLDPRRRRVGAGRVAAGRGLQTGEEDLAGGRGIPIGQRETTSRQWSSIPIGRCGGDRINSATAPAGAGGANRGTTPSRRSGVFLPSSSARRRTTATPREGADRLQELWRARSRSTPERQGTLVLLSDLRCAAPAAGPSSPTGTSLSRGPDALTCWFGSMRRPR